MTSRKLRKPNNGIPPEEKKARSDYRSAVRAGPIDEIPVPARLNPGPNAYAVTTEGDCLAPEVNDGDVVVCDPDKTSAPGDFVAVWWKSSRQPSIKRLVLALAPKEYCGGGPRDELEVLLVVEQLNPPRTMSAHMSRVDRVHKVLGKAEVGRA